jgi:hypothetical protein
VVAVQKAKQAALVALVVAAALAAIPQEMVGRDLQTPAAAVRVVIEEIQQVHHYLPAAQAVPALSS